jgi:hypothetical protein
VTGVARLRSLAVLTLVLALAACAGERGAGSPGASIDGSPSAAIGASPDASGASPSASAEASPSAAAGEFTNPVLEANFADPFLLEVDGTYYGYATGNLTWNIQVSTPPTSSSGPRAARRCRSSRCGSPAPRA